jgi:hypothetical protein
MDECKSIDVGPRNHPGYAREGRLANGGLTPKMTVVHDLPLWYAMPIGWERVERIVPSAQRGLSVCRYPQAEFDSGETYRMTAFDHGRFTGQILSDARHWCRIAGFASRCSTW